jgi:O-methyltransferase
VVCQGFFPETATGIEDQFALVSMDADLYKPMLAGLEYFYPRLSPGGFLMLHDYNHPKFLGVKQAVADFEKAHGKVAKLPIADKNGSLLITKI